MALDLSQKQLDLVLSFSVVIEHAEKLIRSDDANRRKKREIAL